MNEIFWGITIPLIAILASCVILAVILLKCLRILKAVEDLIHRIRQFGIGRRFGDE